MGNQSARARQAGDTHPHTTRSTAARDTVVKCSISKATTCGAGQEFTLQIDHRDNNLSQGSRDATRHRPNNMGSQATKGEQPDTAKRNSVNKNHVGYSKKSGTEVDAPVPLIPVVSSGSTAGKEKITSNSSVSKSSTTTSISSSVTNSTSSSRAHTTVTSSNVCTTADVGRGTCGPSPQVALASPGQTDQQQPRHGTTLTSAVTAGDCTTLTLGNTSSVPGEPAANAGNSVSVASDGEHRFSYPKYATIGPDSEVVAGVSPSPTSVKKAEEEDETEAIYAIPIPKSQRQKSSSSSVQSPVEVTHIRVTSPRSPEDSSRLHEEVEPRDEDTFDEGVFSNTVQVTCQMKKSTTTGTLASTTCDYSTLPTSYAYKNDYFSLGRRPKRARIPTLKDNRGMTVSLEMLLRERRQSSNDVSTPSPAPETLSVDDILKSCSDFDQSLPGFRTRTSSDSVKKARFNPCLHTELMNGRVTETNGHHATHSTQVSRSILKRHRSDISPGQETNVAARVAREHAALDTPASSANMKTSTNHGLPAPVTDSLETERVLHVSTNGSLSEGKDVRNFSDPDHVTTNVIQRDTDYDEISLPHDNTKTSDSPGADSQLPTVSVTSSSLSDLHSPTSSDPRSPSSLDTSGVASQGLPSPALSDIPATQLLHPQWITHVDITGSPNLSVDTSANTSVDEPSPRQRSPTHNAKLEVLEALKWLRAAGFPQYSQMYEDGQFPVDLRVVERDHDFLDADSLQSLFRRVETLNKHAGMKIDAHPNKKGASEEEDEEDFCALSERWEYQKTARRWSRKEPARAEARAALDTRSGSHDSLLADQDSLTGDSPLLGQKMPHRPEVMPELAPSEHETLRQISDPAHQRSPDDAPDASISPRLRRAASEKIKSAKNIWKKVEGFKSKKPRRHPHNRNIIEISGPVVADKENMQAKLQKLNCRDISPTSDGLASQAAPDRTASQAAPDRTANQAAPDRTASQAVPVSTQIASDRTANQAAPERVPTQVASDRTGTLVSPREDQAPASSDSLPFRSRYAPGSQSMRVHPTYHTHRPSSRQQQQLQQNSSLDEYYSAHSQLQHTLETSQPGSVRKNNSDTNLLEIFLLPQDHQPGRFPTVLQNGYIETDTSGNTRPVGLWQGRDVSPSVTQTSPAVQQSDVTPGGHRFSFYDNFLPGDNKRESEKPSVIPGVIELPFPKEKPVDRVPTGFSARDSGDAKNRTVNFEPHRLDNIQESRASSVVSNSETSSDNDVRLRGRGSDFDSPVRTLGDSPGESRVSHSSRESSSESSFVRSSKVTHSASVDSYFLPDMDSRQPDMDSVSRQPDYEATLQQDYDEFDQILKQLYDNIKDLNSFVTKDASPPAQGPPRPPSTLAPATTPQLVPTHLNTSLDQDDLVSPTSDLVLSPSSPLSPGVREECTDTSSSENRSSGGDSSNSDDQETGLTDVSHDDSLDQMPDVSMERRDSGVGHSLTRAPGERRRKKIRWHSFQKSHRPDVSSRAMQINSLTAGQLVRLQKLSLLKLTGIMEKCLPVNKSGWNWMVPRFMKRQRSPDFSDKNVFGVPFNVMAQRTGQPLPQCVLYAMRYLRRTCQTAVGIFRKSGVKSKIQQLRDHLEAHPDTTDFEDANAYNVADMLKTYFRDLPECLLTNKMSETFRSIYTHVPQPQRLEAIQAAILLLPDENREVLQSILLFLSDISSHESDHQMNASNLAVCFTPTVFQLGSRQYISHSPKRNRKNSTGIPDPREIMEQKAAHECLLMMITQCKKLFTIPPHQFRQLQVQSLAHVEPAPLQDIGNSPAEVKAFGQERIQVVLKEAHDKNRGWIQTMVVSDVEVFHRKPQDDCPLKEWKFVTDIEAPPIEVLRRIMHERHTWDEDLLSWSVVERLDQHSDIFQYVLNSMAPHPSRHFCILRYWRSDLTKGACALITMSVEHSDAVEVQGVWAVDMGSYFLMEPCGSGRSRITYITRVDTRGRTPDWYTKIYGFIGASFLDRLRESFKQEASGPETKV